MLRLSLTLIGSTLRILLTALVTTLFMFFVLDAAPGGEEHLPSLSAWTAELARGSLGTSTHTEPGAPVAELVARSGVTTAILVSLAVGFSFLFSAALAFVWHGPHGSRTSRGARALAYTLSACPSFVIAYWLSSGANRVLWRGIQGGLFSAPGWFPIPQPDGTLPYLLAAAALAVGSGMLLDASRSLSAELDRVLDSDFILFARANGQRLLPHLAPNLLAPFASWLANRVTALAAGAIVVEAIFRLPGLGRLTWRAALDRDANVVLGVTLAWALVFTLGRALAQGFALLSDPKRRSAAMGGT